MIGWYSWEAVHIPACHWKTSELPADQPQDAVKSQVWKMLSTIPVRRKHLKATLNPPREMSDCFHLGRRSTRVGREKD